MTIDFTIPASEAEKIGREVERQLWMVRSEVQLAMAVALESVVLDNFGSVGIDRPWPWAPLSPAYAKKVGRSYATLEVTGAMKQAVTVGNDDPEMSTVSLSDSDVPYSTSHHFGAAKSNLPARRVFPVDEAGECTPFAERVVFDAAVAQLERSLK